MIRNICFALLLILANGIGATEKIKTVDVISAKKLGDFWGIEFPIEGAEAEPTMGSTLYLDPKGDLVVKFSYSEGQWGIHRVLYHIKQKKIIHSEKEILKKKQNIMKETEQNKFLQKNNFIEIETISAKINTNNEDLSLFYYPTSNYYWSSGIGGDICRPAIEGDIHVRDLRGNLVSKKTLLYASSRKKFRHQSASGCVMEGNGSGRPRKLSTISLHFSWIWQIDDGTVLVEISEIPYLIRLTPQLTSPFVERHPDIQFFKPGVLLPIYEQAFEKHWEKAYQKPDQDVYEIVDEIIFRFVQQNNNRSTALTAQNP